MTPSHAPELPATSLAGGSPVNTILRPTTLSRQPNHRFSLPSTGKPAFDRVRRLFESAPTMGFTKKRCLSPVSVTDFIVMSTRMVASLSNVRLTPFRPALRFPALQTTPSCSRRTDNLHPGAVPPVAMLPSQPENPTPSLSEVGASPRTATLTLPTRPSQAQRFGFPNAPWRHCPSIHETAERRR